MKRILIIMLAIGMPVLYCVSLAPTPAIVADVASQSCATCHGENNVAVLATGRHAIHADPGLYGGSKCEDCHVDNNVSHSTIDGKILMADGKPFTSSTIVCDKCHGSGAALAKSYWKSPAGTWLKNGTFCESCHDGSSTVNAKPAKNIMARYASSGHGNKGRYKQTQHGQRGPGYACEVCHDPAGPGHFHKQPGDSLLRIKNSASGLCLDCHDPAHFTPGKLGFTAFSKASRHSTAITHKYDFNYECATCHDPHGTANLAMVPSAIDGKLGAGPIAITFTDTTMFDPSILDTNGTLHPVDGVCNACHAAGTQADSAHSKTNQPGNHRQGRACWECHFHNLGFDTLATIASIYVDQPEVALTVGGSTQVFVSSISKSNAESDVTGSAKVAVDKPAVVSVDSIGNLTGLSAGTAVITFTYAGLTATVAVTVTSSTSVTFSLVTAAAVGGSVSPATGSHDSGAVVNVQAAANTGFVFSGWSGDLSGNTNPATITMDANKSVTANFSPVVSYTLTTRATFGGSVSPATDAYPSGTMVQITATSNSGFTFTGWSGALTGTTNPTTIIMDANKSVTANFK